MSADRPPRIVVLDDDPTGTQTVSDLPIILSPDHQTLAAAAAQWDGPVWLLTNTRAMRWKDAEAHLVDIVGRVRSVFGPSVQLVLRGDSTLRGHVLGEIDVLSTADSVALFVPAFVEQGRVTIHGVHYVTIDGRRVEVASTEYAHDPEFSYRSSDLVAWVHERDQERPASGLSLETLRRAGSSALADLLLRAPAHSVVAPDVETVEDLEAVTEAWLAAQRRGRSVVLRCASSLASVVTGSPPRSVDLAPVRGPVLVVCASYTSGATEQLAALDELGGIARHEVDVATVVAARGNASGYCDRLARNVADSLRDGRATVLATSRTTTPSHLDFEAGERIMDAVVAVVRQLEGKFAALVTKGGITSARVARDALGVSVAYIRGQVLPGVPVWALDFPPAGAIEQVVVPGNVGERTTIREIVSRLAVPQPDVGLR